MTAFQHIAVVGAGAWGTALAQVVARAGRQVTLWAHEPEVAASINADHANPLFLPGVTLSPAIWATSDLEETGAADAVLLVTPAQHTRTVAAALPAGSAPLVVCAKGFEEATGALMTEVLADTRPDAAVAVLSGPSFAAEVARDLTTAVALGCADPALGKDIAMALAGRSFRAYWNDDPLGVQIGGAVKNVLAIAAGVVMGRELGDNARAALVTRGLSELTRLGRAMGARLETLMGLAGLGDLLLTATSMQSRNTSLGYALGRGSSLQDVMQERHSVAEGVFTAAAVGRLADRCGVEMPICAAVEAILHHSADLDATIDGLLARPARAEH